MSIDYDGGDLWHEAGVEIDLEGDEPLDREELLNAIDDFFDENDIVLADFYGDQDYYP